MRDGGFVVILAETYVSAWVRCAGFGDVLAGVFL